MEKDVDALDQELKAVRTEKFGLTDAVERLTRELDTLKANNHNCTEDLEVTILSIIQLDG